MRNLKKFLALVLAMMMTLSLMVTVNAASPDFADADQVDEKFAEAVEVMSSIGIFRGTDENGTVEFQPKGNVTRAQMAAVVYRLATGDADDTRAHLYREYATFDDVSSTAWYAGYVGFCSDAQIIKGYGDNSFRPNQAVTGYEALAMLLRAVGYGKGGEFEGANWKVNVGATATGEKLLKNVNTSNYAGTLNQTALREMLAEITFQTAQIPTVQYQYGTYNKYTNLISGILNPSLGEKFYGLASYTGVIVGNQQTGEEYTKLSMTMNKDGSIKGVGYYHTTDTSLTADNSDYTDDALVLTFDTETGVDQFGHKVKVWFDNRTSGAKTAAITRTAAPTSFTYDSQFGTVYTVMDQSTKVAVVSTSGLANDQDSLTDANGSDKKYLGGTAAGKDFIVDETNGAYNSDAFAAIADAATTIPKANSGNTYLFLLISNSEPDSKGKCALDVVISLGVQVQTITKVNAFDNTKTVTVTDANTPSNTIIGTKDAFVTGTYENILVYGADDIKVGSYVVTNKIYGTGTDLYGAGADGTNLLWGINALTKTESGIITSVAGDGKVTLSNGTTLEMSPLFEVGVGAAAAASGATMNTARKDNDLVIGSNMTFTLDKDGKYVGAKPAAETYIYADYAYWVQEGIDNFKYFLKGVGLDGQELTVEIDKGSYDTINGAANAVDIRVMSNSMTASTTNIVVPSTANSLMHALYVVDDLKQGTKANGAATALTAAYTEAPNTYTLAADATEGVTLKPDTKFITGSTPLAYITNETQFHVLTGWGSTMKVEHYTGLEALLGGATSMNVQGIYTLGAIDTEHAGGTVNKNSGITHMIIINGKKVENGAFLYVADAPTSTGFTKDAWADQFALYLSGESTKTNLLVKGSAQGTPGSTGPGTSFNFNGGHHFYDYELTEKGYYDLKQLSEGIAAGNSEKKWVITENVGFAQAGSKMGYVTTSGGDAIEVTDNTKIIDITDPNNGIDSYAKLSQAIEENVVKADILQTAEGSGEAAVIYVYSVAQRT